MIKGLTDREAAFPQIGSIRKGAPKGERKPGADLKHFRVIFDEEERESAAAFRKVYGDEPAELNVLLPFNDLERCFDAWYEAYTAGALVYRSDGERVLRELEPDTGKVVVNNGVPEKKHRENPIGFYTNKQGRKEPIKAKATGRLKVIIPELARAAYLVVHTTSIHDVANLASQLRALLSVNNGRLAGIPLKLRRRPVKISTPSDDEAGKRVRREKWMLSIEADPQWVAACLIELKRAALPGNGLDLARLAPPATVIMGTVEPDDEEEEWEDEGEGEETEEAEGTTEHEAEPVANGSARPLAPDVLRRKLATTSRQHVGKTASPNQRGLVAGVLEVCFAGEGADQKRHSVQVYLTGCASLSDMPDANVLALLDWLKPAKDSGGAWLPEAMACQEAGLVLRAALVEAGQQEMPMGAAA